MIIRGKPKDIENYVMVNGEETQILHKNGFFPKYINSNDIYYFKTKELLEFMKGGNFNFGN